MFFVFDTCEAVGEAMNPFSSVPLTEVDDPME